MTPCVGTYLCHSALFQIMACHLIGAKPLPEPILSVSAHTATTKSINKKIRHSLTCEIQHWSNCNKWKIDSKKLLEQYHIQNIDCNNITRVHHYHVTYNVKPCSAKEMIYFSWKKYLIVCYTCKINAKNKLKIGTGDMKLRRQLLFRLPC